MLLRTRKQKHENLILLILKFIFNEKNFINDKMENLKILLQILNDYEKIKQNSLIMFLIEFVETNSFIDLISV